MKETDIMVGDWVYVLDNFTHEWNMQQVDLDLLQRIKNQSWSDTEIVKGVKLTADILRNSCTHHKQGSDEYHFYDTPVMDMGSLGIFIGTCDKLGQFASFAELQYVHDLQHALKIVGWEQIKIKFK